MSALQCRPTEIASETSKLETAGIVPFIHDVHLLSRQCAFALRTVVAERRSPKQPPINNLGTH